MIDHPLVKKALSYATYHHGGQVRKYTGELYINHPIAVAERTSRFVKDPEAVAAALLHDVVEDTGVILEQIEAVFGETVAGYVWYLTKPPAYVGNRGVRKQLDRDRLSKAPEVVRLIKVFDLMHNAASIKEHDPKFWETFREESVLLLEALDAEKVVNKFCSEKFISDEFQNFLNSLD